MSCDICTEVLKSPINEESSDYIICTPCGHVFHMKCIDDWFRNANSCPNCRQYCTHIELKRIFLSGIEYDSQPTQLIQEHNLNNTDEINFLKSVNQSLQEQYDVISASNKVLCEYKEQYETITMLNVSLEEQITKLVLNMNISQNHVDILQVECNTKDETIEDLEKKLSNSNEQLSALEFIIKSNAQTIQYYKSNCEELSYLLNHKTNALKNMTDINTTKDIEISQLKNDNNSLRISVEKFENDLNNVKQVNEENNVKQLNEENCFNERRYFRVEMKRIS